jgi:hypothetical protein
MHHPETGNAGHTGLRQTLQKQKTQQNTEN